ncbi:MAG: sugar kinase [Lysobacterales bacterium]|jgi:adenosine kinase|nr:MAG: sugar kinase [Xanthomonadales bacterium]
MRALICGSLAYDTIMVFPDYFRNHILPEQVHLLNVAFLVPEMRREFGGCAGNIAYNLKLLGGDPVPMATVGEDFGPYREHLERHGIDLSHVHTIKGSYTAQAFITTDLADNQITAFHPGAMMRSHELSVFDAKDVRIGIVAPDSREAMLRHARELAEAGIPFVFDPGQAMPLFSGEEFRHLIELAQWVTVNDYECQLLKERTGWSERDIAERVRAFIVTRGGVGSLIHTSVGTLEIPAVPAERIVDPTGCGDAYRAGLLYALLHELPLELAGRMASLMGAIKIAHPGTQNHRFERETFEKRFREAFGIALSLP